MTIDSNQDWNGHKPDGERGAATKLFDNTGTELIHTIFG